MENRVATGEGWKEKKKKKKKGKLRGHGFWFQRGSQGFQRFSGLMGDGFRGVQAGVQGGSKVLRKLSF